MIELLSTPRTTGEIATATGRRQCDVSRSLRVLERDGLAVCLRPGNKHRQGLWVRAGYATAEEHGRLHIGEGERRDDCERYQECLRAYREADENEDAHCAAGCGLYRVRVLKVESFMVGGVHPLAKLEVA